MQFSQTFFAKIKSDVRAGRRVYMGLCALCLLMGGSLLTGCIHTPDAAVGNQGTKTTDDTGAIYDSAGHVVSNPSTGAGDRKGLGN